MKVEGGIVPVGKPQKCLRVESWRENLRKAIERATDPNDFRLCPAAMPLILRPLQAITNAPECYDYGWMHTVIGNIAVDDRGRSCRLVENDDEWHFRQQLLRYGSGLHLVIDDQKQLDDFLRRGWLKLTDTPIPIHRIKVDLHQALRLGG